MIVNATTTAMIFGFLKPRRADSFAPEWKTFLTRKVPIFRRLRAADQDEVLGHVQVASCGIN
jgi:hypothetical protein